MMPHGPAHPYSQAPAAAPGWPAALSALFVLLALILALYWETAERMVVIWMRSQTFTHGFLVPPIVLWLIWKKRRAVAALSPASNVWMILPLFLAGIAWLLGHLTATNAVTFLALIAMLVLTVPTALGLPVARALVFPLGYLFFAAPIGEFAMPQMMDWTADFTVKALQFTGIPVYREGLSFVIPSGNWSVEEACSGVRYLIASVVVGTLYAYLNYRSLTRRLVFVALSIVVPIIANWFRAYMIVMLGHLSNNRLAVGVDHLIYGWIFFGVVILAMFAIGARWAERQDEFEGTGGPTLGRRPLASGSPAMLVTALIAALAIVVPRGWHETIARSEASRSSAVSSIALSPPKGWELANPAVFEWQPAFKNPTTSLHEEFVRDQQRVGVYIGYYRRQDYEQKLISSRNTLIKPEDPDWKVVTSGIEDIPVGTTASSARTYQLRGPQNRRLSVWQLYWVNGHWMQSEYVAKIWQALSRLAGHGDDSAVVVMYVPRTQADDGGGRAAIESFLKALPKGFEPSLRGM